MIITLNDGRKLNMIWVVSFFQDKNKVIYETAKGQRTRIEEVFETENDAKTRVEELEQNFVI